MPLDKNLSKGVYPPLSLNYTIKEYKMKPVTNKVLADFLGISEQAAKMQPKNKNVLMKYGLAYIKSDPKLEPLYRKLKPKP